MKYEVVGSLSLDKLMALVQNCLDEGWKLQGGICACHTGQGTAYFYQAVIKELP